MAPGQAERARPQEHLKAANTKDIRCHRRSDLESRTSDIFRWIAEKKLEVRIDRTFSFREASRSHVLLASRQTIGKVMLVPEVLSS
jgi:NADPH:quinone reductase-like Zn-dependent oxidoreductase